MVRFLNKKVIPPFRAPVVILSDNVACFRAQAVQDFAERRGTKWKTMSAYAAISNGMIERIVATIRKSFARLVTDSVVAWDTAATKAVFGYCLRSVKGGPGPSELLYDIKPKVLTSKQSTSGASATLRAREIETLTLIRLRASKLMWGLTRRNPKIRKIFHSKWEI